MRKRLATFVAATAGIFIGSVAGPLHAADFGAAPVIVPPPPHVAAAFDWSGHYVGAHLGTLGLKGPADLAWGAGDYLAPDSETALYIMDVSRQSLGGHAWGGGLQAGFNVQRDVFVWGIEADLSAFGGQSASSADGSIQATNFTVGYTASAAWLATLRARAGVAADRLFLYGTAGIGAGDIDFTWTFEDDTDGFGTATDRGTRAFAVIGGGVEYAIHDRASVKLEYVYAPLGAFSATSDSVGLDPQFNTVTGSANLGLHFVRLGLNWRFGGGH